MKNSGEIAASSTEEFDPRHQRYRELRIGERRSSELFSGGGPPMPMELPRQKKKKVNLYFWPILRIYETNKAMYFQFI